MNTELLRKVTKVHTSDGVYDGSMCHEAADEIKRLEEEVSEYKLLVKHREGYIKTLIRGLKDK